MPCGFLLTTRRSPNIDLTVFKTWQKRTKPKTLLLGRRRKKWKSPSRRSDLVDVLISRMETLKVKYIFFLSSFPKLYIYFHAYTLMQYKNYMTQQREKRQTTTLFLWSTSTYNSSVIISTHSFASRPSFILVWFPVNVLMAGDLSGVMTQCAKAFRPPAKCFRRLVSWHYCENVWFVEWKEI